MRKHLTFLIMTLCALTFSCSGERAMAQTPGEAISIREKLPNGEYIVVVGGVEQRTLTAEHARAILKTHEDLDRAERTRTALESQIAIYDASLEKMREVVSAADKQRKEEAGIALNFKALYEGERALRLVAEKLHSPGKVSNLFNNPVVQIGTKIGLPVFQSWLTARIRNTTVVMTNDQLALLQSQWRGQPMFVPLR